MKKLMLVLAVLMLYGLALADDFWQPEMQGLAQLKREAILICPVCRKGGVKSKVILGECEFTWMPVKEFYDEKGRYRSENQSYTTCILTCSRAHKFQTKFY